MRRNAFKQTFPNMTRVQKILRYVTQNLHLSDLKIVTKNNRPHSNNYYFYISNRNQ